LFFSHHINDISSLVESRVKQLTEDNPELSVAAAAAKVLKEVISGSKGKIKKQGSFWFIYIMLV
jgi:hypothetical protein